MKLRALVAIAACLNASAAAQTFTWRNVNIQGMGYVTGLIAHPAAPHDIYIRTDVGGAYRLDRSTQRWIPLMDRYGTDYSAVYGVESIAGDPGDANTVYAAVNGVGADNVTGEVLVSHSRGALWDATGLAAQKIYLGANDVARGMTGERLALDPLKPSRLYFGSRKDGLWIKDGDAGWAKAAGGLPQKSDAADTSGFGVTFVLADRNSGKAANGATRRVYAGVYVSGVWMSNDGGASWTKIYDMTTPVRAALASDGTLFVAFGGDEGATAGSLRRYKGGAWTDVSPLGKHDSYSGISTDPTDARAILAAANSDFRVYRSTDQGVSWTRVPLTPLQNQPAYYPGNAGGWGNAALVIDPVNVNRAWTTNGYGVIKIEGITAAAPVWSWVMNNLEELVVMQVKVPPLEGGADLLSAVADMVGHRHASRNAPPAATIAKFQWVAQGDSIAYCAKKPEYAAFVGWDETNWPAPMTGFTPDNGKTWTPFTSVAPGAGGTIAMSATDPLNMVWVPAQGWDVMMDLNKQPPQYTTDGGKTWNLCKLGSGNLPVTWQIAHPWWGGSQVVTADMVRGGRFYYYYWPLASRTTATIYTSEDGGATWSKAGTLTSTDPDVSWNVRLNVVPNPVKEGDVWIALSRNSNKPKAFKLFHSADAGKTWSAVQSADGCNFVAFGRGNTDAAPFIYIHGRVGGATEDAIYKSEDMGGSWIRVSDPAQHQFGSITSLEGDMRTRDLVYVGLGGRGIMYGYGAGSGIAQPSFPPNGIVNAASFAGNGAVAPGELVTIFGTDFGSPALTKEGQDESGFLSTTSGQDQILFDGQPAVTIASSRIPYGQVSAVAPYWLAGRNSSVVQVLSRGELSPPVTVPVMGALPGVFSADWSGKGQAVAVNVVNGTRVLNDKDHPASRDGYLELYVTGVGQTSPPGIDGWPPVPPFPQPSDPPRVFIGGIESQWSQDPYNFAGMTFAAGIMQINVRVPEDAPAGPAVPLKVQFGDATSQDGLTVAIAE